MYIKNRFLSVVLCAIVIMGGLPLVTGFVSNNASATSEDDFFFIHLTDTHVGGWRDRDSSEDASADFQYVQNQILSMSPKPAFVILSGDIVDYGAGMLGAGNYEKLISYLHKNDGIYYLDSSYQIPIHFCPGNHDYYYFVPQGAGPYSLDNYHNYLESRDDYTFTYKNTWFCSLDSGHDVFNEGSFILPEGSGLTDEQITYLDEQLDSLDGVRNHADYSGYHKIIFMHHPVINFNDDNNEDGVISQNRQAFLDICDRYKVDVQLCGHTHRSIIYDKNGNEWNDGSTGTMFVQTASGVDCRAYRKIDVNSNGVFVDGEKANPVVSSVKVYVKIHRIAEDDGSSFEGLFMGSPDWYWHVGVLQDTNVYTWHRHTQDDTVTGDDIIVDETYTFENIQPEYVYLVITLCEDDGWSSDDELADISSDSTEGISDYASNIYPVTEPPQGSFIAKYYIKNNTLAGDQVVKNGIYYKTSGEFDGNNGDLDASVWFEIWDSYNEVFSDGFDDLGQWYVGSDGSDSWAITNLRYHSYLNSAKCTPDSNYDNNMNTWMYRYTDLSPYSNAVLHFFIWQDSEEGYDYARVLAWYDSSWHELWSRSGTYDAWDEISIDVPVQTSYIGFQFYSDSSVNYEGVYIDDVVLTGIE